MVNGCKRCGERPCQCAEMGLMGAGPTVIGYWVRPSELQVDADFEFSWKHRNHPTISKLPMAPGSRDPEVEWLEALYKLKDMRKEN